MSQICARFVSLSRKCNLYSKLSPSVVDKSLKSFSAVNKNNHFLLRSILVFFYRGYFITYTSFVLVFSIILLLLMYFLLFYQLHRQTSLPSELYLDLLLIVQLSSRWFFVVMYAHCLHYFLFLVWLALSSLLYTSSQ